MFTSGSVSDESLILTQAAILGPAFQITGPAICRLPKLFSRHASGKNFGGLGHVFRRH
jgi:hypothetical protein